MYCKDVENIDKLIREVIENMHVKNINIHIERFDKCFAISIDGKNVILIKKPFESSKELISFIIETIDRK